MNKVKTANRLLLSTATIGVVLVSVSNGVSAQTASRPIKKSADIRLTCVTSYPTTSFVIQTIGDEVEAKIIHHNGIKYMPVYSGILTPNDLPKMAAASTSLAKLGDRYSVRFPVSECERFGEKLISCTGGKPAKINGVDYQAWTIYSSKTTQETIAGRYEQINVSVHMDVGAGADKKNHIFSMTYAADECSED